MEWEYKVLWIGSMAFAESDLNSAGEEGWELVGIYTDHNSNYTYAVFKREKE